jgi:hypothetical protein
MVDRKAKTPATLTASSAAAAGLRFAHLLPFSQALAGRAWIGSPAW